MIVIALGQALISFNVSALLVSMGGMVHSFRTPPTFIPGMPSVHPRTTRFSEITSGSRFATLLSNLVPFVSHPV